MIAIKYKTNAQKCIEANAKTYKRKPVFKRARKLKKELSEMVESSDLLKGIDFAML